VLMVRLAETPLTGEPDAGEPLVRFGGRGGAYPTIPALIGWCGLGGWRHIELAHGRFRTHWPCFSQALKKEPTHTGKAGVVFRWGRGTGAGAVARSPAGGVSANHRLVSAGVQTTGLAGERELKRGPCALRARHARGVPARRVGLVGEWSACPARLPHST